jgi:hypothetical protein
MVDGSSLSLAEVLGRNAGLGDDRHRRSDKENEKKNDGASTEVYTAATAPQSSGLKVHDRYHVRSRPLFQVRSCFFCSPP